MYLVPNYLPKSVHSELQNYLGNSANPRMEIQPQTLILGSNMSSGVTVPNFGKKFAKLRQCEQFEVQENISKNKASV